jgi:2-oxoglutarate ferredoxin oxidoreductase subunit beta
VSPGLFALGSGARFIARAIDVDKPGLGSVLEAANSHKGTAFVEIFQNCIVYNDNVFGAFTDKKSAADTQIHVRHGEPLVFGKDGSKGLRFDVPSMKLEIVPMAERAADVLVHDEKNATLAQLLLSMEAPDFPVALGVVYRNETESFESKFYRNHPTQLKRTGRVNNALRQTNTWWVK